MIYDISYKSYKPLTRSKPVRIGFNKIDRFNRIYDGTRYLVLFGPEKYDAIHKRIRDLISLKSKKCFFSLLRKNQSLFLWFFTYRKNIEFACYNTY